MFYFINLKTKRKMDIVFFLISVVCFLASFYIGEYLLAFFVFMVSVKEGIGLFSKKYNEWLLCKSKSKSIISDGIFWYYDSYAKTEYSVEIKDLKRVVIACSLHGARILFFEKSGNKNDNRFNYGDKYIKPYAEFLLKNGIDVEVRDHLTIFESVSGIYTDD